MTFTRPLCDLHIHVGASVAPHIMWSIAHSQGFKLPTKDYFEFVDLITVNPKRVKSLDDYLKIMHEVTEKIQSSPAAIERSVYEIIGKEYRGSLVGRIELRFNPMKRNLGGERDLDHIIHAAIRGMDRACLEYNIEAGLIFCLAREFKPELNEILVEKAIRYRERGVIGIDVAGPESHTIELDESVGRYEQLFARARDAGLGTTIHTGETESSGADGVIAVVSRLKPHRIGHGIRAAYSDEALSRLADAGTLLEICPTSNLHTRAVRHLEEFRYVLGALQQKQIPFSINTDGTYLCRTNLRREYKLLIDSEILTPAEADACNEAAYGASFL